MVGAAIATSKYIGARAAATIAAVGVPIVALVISTPAAAADAPRTQSRSTAPSTAQVHLTSQPVWAKSTVTVTVTTAAPSAARPVWLERKTRGDQYWSVIRQVARTTARRFTFKVNSGPQPTYLLFRALEGKRAGAARTLTVTAPTLGSWSLGPATFLTSPDRRYRLTMRPDGNLVESVNGSGRVLWTSNTSGHPNSYAAVYPSGIFYVETPGSNGITTWEAGPGTDSTGSWQVALQNDANVVLYNGATPAWGDGATNTEVDQHERLGPGQSIVSPDGHYELTMQPDGNLVETVARSGRPIWASGTSGHTGAVLAENTDGTVSIAAGGRTLWHTSTQGSGGHLVVQNDANIVQYPASGSALWGSGTVNPVLQSNEALLPAQYILSSDGAYTLVMQADGNLVQYHGGAVTWASNTPGHPGAWAVMQDDGNLVVYDAGIALWATGTGGDSGAWVANQTDGNIVIYLQGVAKWASHDASTSDPRLARAVAWSQSHAGNTSYDGYCERMAENAYGTSGKYPSARADYLAQKAAGALHTDANPPAGALVFETGSDPSLGHIGISAGGGKYWTSDGTVHLVTLSYGGPYLGWSYAPPSWPGA